MWSCSAASCLSSGSCRGSPLCCSRSTSVAILLVKVNVGLIAPSDAPGVGAELDLALIAGLLVIPLAGPGKLSLDYALGVERDAVEERTTA